MKHLIAVIIGAFLGFGSAVAGPVVVTPGSVAGYMYIEGSGSSSSVLPVVTENVACTATTSENTGINSTFTKVLTCNGGTWKPLSVGALQTVTAGAACTASATNNVGVDSAFTKPYMCISGTWQEYSPTAKGVQVATEGGACAASATNNVAVTADYKLLLTCQSGVWGRDPSTSCPSGQAYMGGTCQSVASFASSASGTICGYWSDPNSWYGYAQSLCQGHSPNSSCPAGYHQHYILQWSTNNYVCVKD